MPPLTAAPASLRSVPGSQPAPALYGDRVRKRGLVRTDLHTVSRAASERGYSERLSRRSRAAGAVSVFPFSSRDGCGFPRRQLAAGVIVGSIFYHPREQSLRFNTFENFPCNRAKQSWRMTSALQFRVGPHGQKQTMRKEYGQPQSMAIWANGNECAH